MQANAGAVSCVRLDLRMPGMSGEEALQALRRVDPDVKVVVMTGDSDVDTLARLSLAGLAGFVEKPFGVEALRDALSAALAPKCPALPWR